MVDAATSRGYGGVLLKDDSLSYFGGVWPEDVRVDRIIPIFVLEALAAILGTLTWGHLFRGKKIILRSDSSNTCGAFNNLKSDNTALRLLSHLWAECQEEFEFEGLLFHCPGKDNQCADIASRFEEGDIEEGLRVELDSYGLQSVEISRNETVWRVNAVSARLIPQLTALSLEAHAANAERKKNENLQQFIASGKGDTGDSSDF